MTGEARGSSSELSHTSLEFEIATSAADGSGFSGDKVPCSSSRLCHREACEVRRRQPEQQTRDQPGDLRPPLLQEALLHPLDAQPDLPGRQVLDENLQQRKNQVHDGINLWPEGVWWPRLFSPRGYKSSSNGSFGMSIPLDSSQYPKPDIVQTLRLLSLPWLQVFMV